MSEILIDPVFLLDWKAAEAAAVVHMRAIGFTDAQATSAGTDGGIDALSSDAAAQVKFYANPVGRPDIQRLRGAAHEYRIGLFYSTGSYTKEAVSYASEAGVALFLMDPYGQCAPVTELAALLVEPGLVQERRQRMDELQASRYEFAASACESDLELFGQFTTRFTLSSEENSFFSYVAANLAVIVRDFRSAIQIRDFPLSDRLFSEFQIRSLFLSRMVGAAWNLTYDHLEDAIAAGWQQDAAPNSDSLLGRAAAGVRELDAFLSEAYDAWGENFPDGVTIEDLVNSQTRRFAGLLEVASLDFSVLDQDLLAQLKTSVIEGVNSARFAAESVYDHIRSLQRSLGLAHSREMVARQLQAERIASRVLQQLDANDA